MDGETEAQRGSRTRSASERQAQRSGCRPPCSAVIGDPSCQQPRAAGTGGRAALGFDLGGGRRVRSRWSLGSLSSVGTGVFGHVLGVCHLSQGRVAEQSDLLGPIRARHRPPLCLRFLVFKVRGLTRCSLRAVLALTTEIPDTVAGFGGALQEDFTGGEPWWDLRMPFLRSAQVTVVSWVVFRPRSLETRGGWYPA